MRIEFYRPVKMLYGSGKIFIDQLDLAFKIFYFPGKALSLRFF
jgi:hypothetical protein